MRMSSAITALQNRADDEFYAKNLNILKDEISRWNERARKFVEKIALKLNKPDDDVAPTTSQRVTALMEETNLDLDPEDQVLCAPATSSANDPPPEPVDYKEKIKEEIEKYVKSTDYVRWRAEKIAAKKLDTSCANIHSVTQLLFWKEMKNTWPLLSQAAIKVKIFIYAIINLDKICNTPSTSAEIERSFSVMAHDLKRHSCNQKVEHVALLAKRNKFRRFKQTLQTILEDEELPRNF
jgi:hypothetical protein